MAYLDVLTSDHIIYTSVGLQLATERSKAVDKFGRQTITYLKDMATTYDTFGQVLLKASHSIHPDVWKVFLETDIGIDAAKSSSPSEKTQSCFDSVRHLGITSRRLAQYYRTQVIAPLQTTLFNNREVLETHGQRYIAARAQCKETRNRALAARISYLRVLRATEKTFRLWKRARNMAIESGTKEIIFTKEIPTTSPQWENVIREYGKVIPKETDELVAKLYEVETARIRYEDLVGVENDAVAYAQKMEIAALDAVQGVENDRIHFFLESVVKTLCEADDNHLNQLPETPESVDLKPNADETTSIDLKKGKDLLANIFIRQNISYEEGMGRTDAETLGLPLTSGTLRDDVKKQVSTTAACIKAAQILTEFLEVFGGAISSFEAGLKADSMPANAQQEPLGAMAFNTTGPIAADMWKGVVKIHEDQAAVVKEVAAKVAKLRLEKLERFVETAQKDLKSEKEFDDSNWKTLCEVARTESKSAARYRQVRAQQEKARERVHSVDIAVSDDSVGSSTAQKGRMGKALLAGGEAVKKFHENARIAIAKSNLNEADQIAAKEQQALDEATATKSYAIADYKRVTETRIWKLEAMSKQVQKDVEDLMEEIILGIKDINQARLHALGSPLDGVTHESLMQDVEEWVQSVNVRIEANRKIALIDEDERQKKESDWGYQLSIDLLHSEPVTNLLKLSVVTIPAPEFMTKADGSASAESSDEEFDMRGVNSSFESNGSIQSAKGYPSGGSVYPPTGHDLSIHDLTTGDTQPSDTEPSNVGSLFTPATSPSVLTQRSAIEHTESNIEESSPSYVRTHESHDIQVFIRHFWNQNENIDKAPEILRIITCAYRPKEKAGFLIPTLHGRLYTTTDKLYFLALDGKSFVLAWDDIVSVGKEKGFMVASDTAIVVTYKASDTASSFVLSRLDSRDAVLAHLQNLKNQAKCRNDPKVEDEESLPSVPPDALLKKMTIVLSRTLRGVSILEVYEKAWSEGNRTSEEPFYGPWLQDEECFEINVENWEFAEGNSQGFVGPWCGEHYTQRRLTTFKFKRTSHLYIGPPVAFVKQMHYCRVEGNDKCVVAISATFEGIPYSDAFSVEMRWVARRHGTNDLDIEVGLEVDFKKSTMLRSTIKAGTIDETTNVHVRMFDAIKKVCGSKKDSGDHSVAESVQEVVEEQEVTLKRDGLLARFWNTFTPIPVNPNFLLFAAATLSYPFVWNFFSALLGAPAISMNEALRLNIQIQELRQDVQELRKSLDEAIDVLKATR